MCKLVSFFSLPTPHRFFFCLILQILLKASTQGWHIRVDGIARNKAQSIVKAMLSSTAFGRPGYSPFTDPNLMQNFQSFVKSFGGGSSSSSRCPLPGANMVSLNTVRVNLSTATGIRYSAVTIPPRSSMTARLTLSGQGLNVRLANMVLNAPIKLKEVVGLGSISQITISRGGNVQIQGNSWLPGAMSIARNDIKNTLREMVLKFFNIIPGINLRDVTGI